MSLQENKPRALKAGDYICLSGGGGYLGRHVAAALLEHGFHVVLSLRDLAKAEPIRAALSAYLGQSNLPLTFVQTDLTREQGWDAALKGCDAFVHTASPFPDRPPKDASELIKTAVAGTEMVMRIAHAENVKRIVQTSSIAAVINTPLYDKDDRYDESYWSDENDSCTDGYALSKLKAEQRAWDVATDLGLDLTTLNPGLIFGPPIGASGATSVALIKRYLRGRETALPRAAFPSVDVKDVAQAHVRALLQPKSIGQRLILSEDTLSMIDIADTIGKLYPSRAIKTGVASDSMVRMAARFDPTLENIIPHLGKAPLVSSKRAKSILGLELGSVRGAVKDTARVFMEQEIAQHMQSAEITGSSSDLGNQALVT